MVRGFFLALIAGALIAGCGSDPPPVTPPAEGPVPPAWLHVTATAPTRIALAWDDVTTIEAGFQIERSLRPTDGFTEIDTVAADTQEYVDSTNVQTGTRYYYRILSYDAIGRRGDASSIVWGDAVFNATPEAPHDPVPPADSLGILSLMPLSWECEDPDGSTVYFTVYFGTSRLNLNVEARQLTIRTHTHVEPVALSTSYFWRVVAADDHGATALSPIWSFVTLVETVTLPGGYLFRGDCGLFNPRDPDLYCAGGNPIAIDAFEIDKFEVTNQLYARFLQNLLDERYIKVEAGVVMDNNPTNATVYTRCYPDGSDDSGIMYSPLEGERGVFAPRPGKENHPVVEVTWDGAQRFAASLDPPRRLPTEAEWEYAARGTTSQYGDTLFAINDTTLLRVGLGSPYPWGDASASRYFNHLGSGDPFESPVGVATTPVGFYDGSNKSGYATSSNASTWAGAAIFDLAGNVAEWCADDFIPDQGGAYGHLKVIKGGSWRSEKAWCQTFWRVGISPDSSDNAAGFRTVRSLGGGSD